VGFANYKIVGNDGAWQVEHDGRTANTYDTKEAAFEAAVAAASLALREGHEILLAVPGGPNYDPAVLNTLATNNIKERHRIAET